MAIDPRKYAHRSNLTYGLPNRKTGFEASAIVDTPHRFIKGILDVFHKGTFKGVNKAPLLISLRQSPKVATTLTAIIKVSEGVASFTALQNGT
jgi:hypothetical protein